MLDKLLLGFSQARRTQAGQQYIKWLKTPQSYVRVLQGVDYRDNSMVAAQQIKSNQQILLISTEKCFTSAEFMGCDLKKSQELQSITAAIAHKYFNQNKEQEYFTNGLMRIILQLFVHQKDQALPMSPFASFLTANETSPFFWNEEIMKDISSKYTNNLIRGTLLQSQQMYSELTNNRMYGMQAIEFMKAFQIVRQNLIWKPKHFDMQSILVLSPIVYDFEHSFDPNCYVDGCYLSHENMSYVEVSSKRAIEPGEKLSINYGNLSNHDLMMRHGVFINGNPHSSIALNLDFSKYLEYSSIEYEEKKRQLRNCKVDDVERVVLYRDRVNAEYIKYLQIYFSKNLSNLEESNEIVNQFMRENISRELGGYRNSEHKQLQQLQEDEISVLKSNLKFFKK